MNEFNPENYSTEQKQKYAFLFEYNGLNFAGSQIQDDLRTVQSELEKALEIVLKEKIRVTLSGRTDTGVNALSQAGHFVTNEEFESQKLIYSLNSILPDDIALRAVEPVSSAFHARKSATHKWYRYVIYNNRARTALNKSCYHVHRPLDINLMNSALGRIIGTHEFDSFRNSNFTSPSAECSVYKAFCTRDRDYIYIDFVANRFLYNMIRILVGTLLEVGLNEKPVNHLYEVLQAHDRTQAGITIDPEGLILMAVEYPQEFQLFTEDKNPKVKDILLGNFMEASYEDLFSKAS